MQPCPQPSLRLGLTIGSHVQSTAGVPSPGMHCTFGLEPCEKRLPIILSHDATASSEPSKQLPLQPACAGEGSQSLQASTSA